MFNTASVMFDLIYRLASNSFQVPLNPKFKLLLNIIYIQLYYINNYEHLKKIETNFFWSRQIVFLITPTHINSCLCSFYFFKYNTILFLKKYIWIRPYETILELTLTFVVQYCVNGISPCEKKRQQQTQFSLFSRVRHGCYATDGAAPLTVSCALVTLQAVLCGTISISWPLSCLHYLPEFPWSS